MTKVSPPSFQNGIRVSGEVTWINESPDLIEISDPLPDGSMYLSSLDQQGTAYLSAVWNGQKATREIHIISADYDAGLSVLSQYVDIGVQFPVKLIPGSFSKFVDQEYTVDWRVDHPELLQMAETEIGGAPGLLVQTLQPGVAHIVCRLTLSDGTYGEAYCTVIVDDEEATPPPEPWPTAPQRRITAPSLPMTTPRKVHPTQKNRPWKPEKAPPNFTGNWGASFHPLSPREPWKVSFQFQIFMLYLG